MTELIKFDLEAALNGAEVITRDGQEVTQVTHFDKVGFMNRSKPPEKLKGFININPDGYLHHYPTKWLANNNASPNRVACIDLSQFEVGHGLEE